MVRGLARLAVLALLVGLVDACGSSPVPVPSAAAVVPEATVPGDCAQRIENANLADASSIYAVDDCRFTTAGEAASALVLANNPSGAPLWAAVWIYGSSASDPAPLRPLLTAGDASIRAMAAAGLVGFGNSTGFPVLRQALSDASQLQGSDPPMEISDFALDVLERYVIADVAPSPAIEVSASELDTTGLRTAWAEWLATHESALYFNDQDGTWSAP